MTAASRSEAIYIFNTRNKATDYSSGDLFHFEHSASYPVARKLRLGVNGYSLGQTVDHRQFGVAVNGDGNRGRVVAIGPGCTMTWARWAST